MDNIEKFYSDGLPFSLKRTYLTANDNYVTTQMSQKFFIKPNSGTSRLKTIRLLDPYKEMSFNGVSDKFKPYSVTVYIYILKDYEVSYNFGKPNKISSNFFWGSTNGLQNNFVNNRKINHIQNFFIH